MSVLSRDLVEPTSGGRHCTPNSYINVTLPSGYITSRPPVEQVQSSFDPRLSPATPARPPGSSTDAEHVVDGQQSPSTAAAVECEHSTNPWVVAAARGQRINLTLYDFALDEAHVTNVQRTHESGRICRQYGWIDDSAYDRPRPLCAGDRRVTHLESSRGHVVKIWTMSPIRSASGEALETTRFMIKYNGTYVVRC